MWRSLPGWAAAKANTHPPHRTVTVETPGRLGPGHRNLHQSCPGWRNTSATVPISRATLPKSSLILGWACSTPPNWMFIFRLPKSHQLLHPQMIPLCSVKWRSCPKKKKEARIVFIPRKHNWKTVSIKSKDSEHNYLYATQILRIKTSATRKHTCKQVPQGEFTGDQPD